MTLFVSVNPFLSIFHFTNHHFSLSIKEKEKFLDLVHRFFSEQAYTDQHIQLGPLEEKRISEIDLGEFYSLMSGINYSKINYSSQLFANISKVVSRNVSLKTFSHHQTSYQICVQTASNEPPLFWGWIRPELLKDSLLLARVENGCLILKPEDIKPSTLLALQRYSTWNLKNCSLESLWDLLLFSIDWKIEKVKDTIVLLFKGVKNRQDFYEGLSNIERKKIEDVFLKREESLSRFEKEQRKLKKIDDVLVCNNEETEGSVWFKEEAPFESIARFTSRCAALHLDEQLAFLSSVRYFFANAAYFEKGVAIPSSLKERFAKIDLPFLLAVTQHKTDERRRFVHNIQIVTGCYFTAIRAVDQVRTLNVSYGETSTPFNRQVVWIPFVSPPSPSGFIDAKRYDIQLSTLTNPRLPIEELVAYGTRDVEELFRLFIFAVENHVELWIDAVSNKFKRLFNGNSKDKFTVLLLDHLGNPRIQEKLRELGITSFYPDITSLNKTQMTDVFAFNMNAKQYPDVPKIIAALEQSEYAVEVLMDFLKNASLSQKKEIFKCCSKREKFSALEMEFLKIDAPTRIQFLETAKGQVEKAENVLSLINSAEPKEMKFFYAYAANLIMDERLRSWVQEIVSELTDSKIKKSEVVDVFAAKLNEEQDYIAQSEKEKKALEETFKIFRNRVVKELFKALDLREIHELVLQSIRTTHPFIYRSGIEEEFFALFPSMSHSTESCLKGLMDIVIAGKERDQERCRSVRGDLADRPDELIRVYHALESENVQAWIDKKAPRLKGMQEAFRNSYHPALYLCREHGLKHFSDDEKVTAFLKHFLPTRPLGSINYSYFIGPLGENYFRELNQDQYIRLCRWLEYQVKLFFANYQQEYEHLHMFFNSLYSADQSANRWMNDHFHHLDASSDAYLFVKEYFRYVCLTANFHAESTMAFKVVDQFSLLGKDHKPLSESEMLHLPKLVMEKRNQVRQWLEQNAPKVTIKFLEEAMEHGLNLKHRYICGLFMKSAELEKWLPSEHYQKVRELLKSYFLVDVSFKWSFIRLPSQDSARVRRVLNEDAIIRLLSTIRLQKARNELLEVIPVSYAAELGLSMFG